MSIDKREELIFCILKELEKNNTSFDESYFNVDKELFFQISEMIDRNGLAKNICISEGIESV